MTSAREMIEASPVPNPFDSAELASAIEACLECVQACTACAGADLAEDEVKGLRRCIGLDLDCADVCAATARVLSRSPHCDELFVQRLLQACVRACSSCAAECESHAEHHRHCAICAEACRACERACTAILEAEALTELQTLAGG